MFKLPRTQYLCSEIEQLFFLCLMSILCNIASGRIVNGRDANPGERPYQLFIQENYKNGGKMEPPFCGAVLIMKKWALTAAHCIRDPEHDVSDEMIVGGGGGSEVVTWDQRLDPSVQIRRIKTQPNVKVHEDFIPKKWCALPAGCENVNGTNTIIVINYLLAQGI